MTATTSDNPRNVNDLSMRILAGEPLDSDESLLLDEFADLYHKISEQSGVTQQIDIILQNDRAIVQFTSLSPGRSRVYVVSNHRLSEQDFSRIIHNPVFHGDVLSTSIKQRIGEERTNLLISFGLGLFFSIVLFVLGNSGAADYGHYLADPDSLPAVGKIVDFITQINEMLLTGATLFLSIFLVFTVAQSSKLQEDIRLFDSGMLHKFERDDRLVALVALTSLLLSILNVAVLGLPEPFDMATWRIGGYIITVNKLSLVSPLMTGLAIAALTFCFLSLLYYLKRTMLITNRDMSIKVLNMATEQQLDNGNL